jgi:Glycosyl hydrolases family 16
MPFLSRARFRHDSRLASAALAALLVVTPIEFRADPGTVATPIRAQAMAVIQDSAPSTAQASVAAGPGSGRCATGGRGAPRGWRRLMSDSFRTDIALGQWGKPGGRHENPGGKWLARAAGTRDTSGRGTYNTMKTTSQHHGLLDVWIHSEGRTRYVAAIRPKLRERRAMRVSVCLRADAIPGYKVVYMLWPTEGPGNYHGEIDYPEAKLNSTSTANAFMHYDPEPRTGKFQDWYDTGVRLQRWHTYTMKWHGGRDYVTFHVDGRRIGRSEGGRVPDGPMIYIMQMETWPQGSLPAPASGHILVDWVTIDVPS